MSKKVREIKLKYEFDSSAPDRDERLSSVYKLLFDELLENESKSLIKPYKELQLVKENVQK